MSSGCGDVLSLDDLKIAKLHQLFEAEVITGLQGGIYGGASIDYATNQVTGQVQKTLPAVLRDAGFRPASFTFTTGGTLTINDADNVVLWPITSGGDGNYYSWKGSLPKVIPASSTPAGTGGVSASGWVPLGDVTLRGDLASTASGEGAELITYKPSPTGTISRNVNKRLNDVINVKDWGAKGDGTTDDTLAIQACIDYASLNGMSTYLPDGVYMVSQLIIKPRTRLYGNGRTSKIKRYSLNGLDLIYGINSNSLWDTTDANVTNFAYDVEIHDLYLDGGVDGVVVPFSSGNAGNAISIWGHNFRWYNLDIQNFADMGIRTQSIDTNIDWAYDWQESSFYSIRIRNVGGHGWKFDGPHDSKFVDISIINPGQKADNTYDGLITGSQGSADFSGIHISNSGNRTSNYQSLRMRYAGNITTPCRFSGGSTFEGARIPLRIACSGSQFDSSCTYYAAWGDTFNCIAIKMEGACSLNMLQGKIVGSSAFRTGNQYGIQFGYAAGDSVNNNYINITTDGCNVPISFGSSTTIVDGDKGFNRIFIKSYYNGSLTPIGTYGILNSANGSILDFEISGTIYLYDKSEYQTRQVSLASGASSTWTFKHPFMITPTISISIANPISTPSGGIWMSSASATAVTVFNGSGQAITLHQTAIKSAV